jgi:protein SCO1/2
MSVAGTSRRAVLSAGLAAGLLAAGPASADHGWHDIDMEGVSPPLSFSMTRASDGKTVTEADYRGKLVLLYFGYTFCADVCPMTLANLARILQPLRKQAAQVRLLFVTVDPNRDTLPALKQYVAAFGPQVVGLRGTPDQLTALARRYRVAFSVKPVSNGSPYEVTHSSAIWVFDRTGAVRLLVPSLATADADISGVTFDLRRLLAETPASGPVSDVMSFLRRFI